FEVQFDRSKAAINEPVRCNVLAGRRSFRGYGMMIAEVGLPPGAEVDRNTLSALVADSKTGVRSFEIAPDHVTFYLWPQNATSKFQFEFRPRFAMKAVSAPSTLYDYYNPDEKTYVTPKLFVVE